MVKMKQVIHAKLISNVITAMNRLTLRFGGYKYMSPRLLIQSNYDLMLQETSRR